MCTISYDFESNTLGIATAKVDTTKENNNFYKCFNVDDLYSSIMRSTSIMCVHGIDCADNEFTFMEETEFRNIVDRYISEFELQPEDIHITSNRLVVNELTVFSTDYTFTSDLCSFTLYQIYKVNK